VVASWRIGTLLPASVAAKRDGRARLADHAPSVLRPRHWRVAAVAVPSATMRLADLVPHAVAASFVALCLGAPAVAAAAAHDVKPVFADPAVDGRYIVVYDRGVDVDAETDRQQRARGFRARFRYRTALKGFAAKLSPGQVRALRADADVAYVTPDRRVRALGAVPLAAGEPAPPPGVRRIQAATLTTTREAGDVGVAVIDTGIDLAHSDLDAAAGANCVTPGAAPSDDNGHGTHVAGTIGARNDGAGVVGVAPGTRVYAVKVLDAGGSGSWSQVICGLDWVTANASRLGIEFANLSLGASDRTTTAAARRTAMRCTPRSAARRTPASCTSSRPATTGGTSAARLRTCPRRIPRS
jgi:subtilisin family serine protease